MTFQLSTNADPALPRLGWIARIDLDTGGVAAEHGALVETGADYLVEGVWNGEFDGGRFDRARHFFGTGLRVTGDAVFAVPSCALVDRLFYWEGNSGVTLSNSLPLLLARMGGRLYPDRDYRGASYTILKGIDDYDPAIPVDHSEVGAVQQLYFDTLRIDAGGVRTSPRPPVRTFGTFEAYVGALRTAVQGLVVNAINPSRRHRLSPYCTTSAGYDSTAVTALLAGTPGLTAFTSRRSNSLIPKWVSRDAAVDDGEPIARHFGASVKQLEYPTSIDPVQELTLLAPSAAEPELIFLSMMEEIEGKEGAVLFTGYHGDKAWDCRVADEYVNEKIIRGDVSGLALSEIRLHAGFVHVAVPFIDVRSIRDIQAISRSPELSDWRLGNDYDRPIPRRILETAGVPRSSFGQRKKAVTRYYNYPINPALRRDFFQYLNARFGWSAPRIYAKDYLDRAIFLGAALLERGTRALRGGSRPTPMSWLWRDSIDFPSELHHWAMDELIERYREGD